MIKKYQLLYKPPKEIFDENNPDTWWKIFYLDKFSCPSELDLSVKIKELAKIYNMKEEYITLNDIEE